jgi:hypothetical protein
MWYFLDIAVPILLIIGIIVVAAEGADPFSGR